jgi:hypothetical protein
MRSRLLLVLLGVAFSACARPPAQPTAIPAGLESPFDGYASTLYSRPWMWLCSPDDAKDPCHGDLSATELRSDGSRVVEPDVEGPAKAEVDCFYVYPTVDLSLAAGNHDDIRDTKGIVSTTVAQAAHFREACSLYVPLYRQVTIGSYGLKSEMR